MIPMDNYPERCPSGTEVVVHLVVSPKLGPRHYIYSEEDIQAWGGIHAIERFFAACALASTVAICAA